jgi:hypothetical protein
MKIHIENLIIELGNDSIVTPKGLPKIGEAWPNVDGIYAGVASGNELEPDGHLVLLDAKTDKDMTWAEAKSWAESVGGRLPTRLESALLYANVRDKLDTSNWHWTGTESQSSSDNAWYQYFYHGVQGTSTKYSTLRARAVIRFPV